MVRLSVIAGDTEITLINLNQAWVNLAVTDNSSLKIGRQTLEIGNGSILVDMIIYKIHTASMDGYSVQAMMIFLIMFGHSRAWMKIILMVRS